MHVDKSLKLLKKINSVFHTILEDSQSVSALERDLLKSYVVQFYDAITVEETVDSNEETNIPKKSESKQIKVPAEDESTQAREDRDAESPARPATPDPTDEPVVMSESAVDVVESDVQTDDVLASLFEEVRQSRSNGHIGERLISDMKKSMGLNDKLRFANVLFGGNQSQLLETLEELNRASHLTEVKAYLNHLAKEYDWTAEAKHKSVSNFLNLVLRKFDSK